MSIDVKTVSGRRDLRYESFDELLADAEKLVSTPGTRTLGNWSLAQLLAHLASAIQMSLGDVPPPTVPWPIRIIGFLVKGRLLRKGPSPGFKLPAEVEPKVYPSVASAEEGREMLRTAVARTKTERMSARHPILGPLTHEEWGKLHLRHAELHLSFAVPGDPA